MITLIMMYSLIITFAGFTDLKQDYIAVCSGTTADPQDCPEIIPILHE
jgi:hypothetical protein